MTRNYNRNETMLDRIMRYGGVQRQPRVMARPQFVQRGGFVPQQRVVQQVQPSVVQQKPVQRRYTPEEIYAIRMEQAKREYEQMAYQAEMERQAAYGVPNMGQGAAARPYEFLMGEADRLGASSGMVPQSQMPQGQVPKQAEPEEQPLTEEEEAVVEDFDFEELDLGDDDFSLDDDLNIYWLKSDIVAPKIIKKDTDGNISDVVTFDLNGIDTHGFIALSTSLNDYFMTQDGHISLVSLSSNYTFSSFPFLLSVSIIP